MQERGETMARGLVFILFLLSLTANGNEQVVCESGEISDPPFFVSDEYRQGDRLYENLRNVEDQGKIDTYLPRETLVKIEPELFSYSDSPSYRVPIKVLSTPSQKREDSAIGVAGRGQRKRFAATMRGTTGLKRAKKGSVGFIHKKSLRKVAKYVFVLQENAPLFKTPGNIDPYSVALSLAMEDGKFQVERCCYSDKELCFDKYKVDLLDKDGEKVASKFINIGECGIFDHVHPLERNMMSKVLPILEKVRHQVGFKGYSIGDLEILSPHQNWKNGKPVKARPALVKFPLSSKGLGPFNTYHYKPDDKKNSDAYLLPGTQCAFLKSLEKFQDKCDSDNPGCLVEIGNMYHHKSWNTHLSHWSGKCIDIRPLKTDKLEDYSNGLTFRSRAYSRKRTTDLINELFDAGAYVVFFNDRKIKAKKRISYDSKKIHDNHIHVCFNPAHKTTKAACEN